MPHDAKLSSVTPRSPGLPPGRVSAIAAAAALAGCLAASVHAEELANATGADGSAAEVTLPAISVTAGSGYRPHTAAGATKTDTPLRETPQSITVITRERIEDMGAQGLQDALNYAAGVRSDAFGLDTTLDWLRVRGTAPDQYLDGLRQTFGFYTSTRPDPYMMERIEVLRGPSAMLYGQGSTAGVVNLVSKRPQREAQREIGLQIGSFRRRQLQADLTGPLSNDWSYRVVALARDAGTQVDFVPDDRLLLVPSLTWQPSAATSLTLQALRQQDRSGSTLQFFPWSGTLLPNPNGQIPTDRFIGEPGFDRYDSDRANVGWLFEHRFDERWTVRQNLRVSSNRVGYRQVAPNVYDNPEAPFVDADQRVLARYAQFTDVKAHMLATDQHLEGRIDAGGAEHRLLLGLDALRFRQADRNFFPAATPIDIYSPVYGTYTPPAMPDNPVRTTQYQVGLYLQDQMKFARNWIAVAGVRRDSARNHQEGADTERSRATSKRLGLMYAADNGWSPYLSYSESFTPVTGTNNSGRFKPLRGKQLEAGVKFEPAGKGWSINAAAYKLRETNQVVDDPVTPGNRVQLGSTETHGVELEGLGRIGRTLDISAHYNYLRNDPQLMALPRHQAALWAKQRLRIAGLDGFSLALGVRHFSAFRDNPAPATPPVTLADAAIAWDSDRWRYALNAVNLADKTYVASCLGRGDCFYGARRSLLLSATHRF
jgi:iron complex outermembrane receptor protein